MSYQKAPFWLLPPVFQSIQACTRPGTPPPSIPPQGTIKDVPDACLAKIHPVQMTKILQDIFQDPQTAHKYVKYLDKKVQAGSSVSVELEVNSGSRESSRAHHIENPFSEAHDKGNYPTPLYSRVSGV